MQEVSFFIVKKHYLCLKIVNKLTILLGINSLNLSFGSFIKFFYKLMYNLSTKLLLILNGKIFQILTTLCSLYLSNLILLHTCFSSLK